MYITCALIAYEFESSRANAIKWSFWIRTEQVTHAIGFVSATFINILKKKDDDDSKRHTFTM